MQSLYHHAAISQHSVYIQHDASHDDQIVLSFCRAEQTLLTNLSLMQYSLHRAGTKSGSDGGMMSSSTTRPIITMYAIEVHRSPIFSGPFVDFCARDVRAVQKEHCNPLFWNLSSGSPHSSTNSFTRTSNLLQSCRLASSSSLVSFIEIMQQLL